MDGWMDGWMDGLTSSSICRYSEREEYTCAIRDYHHKNCEFGRRSCRGVLDTTLCDKVCQ